jgi:hypothetical protein
MNESGHQFRRYVRRMMGRRLVFQALCECGWLSPMVRIEGAAWLDYCKHSEETREATP